MNENEKQSSMRIKRYRSRNKPYDRSESQNKSLFSRVSKKVSEFIPYTLQLLTNKVLNFSSMYGQSSDEENIPGKCGVENYHDVCQSLDDYESYKPPLLPDSISGPSGSAVSKETLFASIPFRVTPSQKKICDNVINDHKRFVHLEEEIGDENSSVTSSGCSSMIPHAHSDLIDEKNRIFSSTQNNLLLQTSKNHIVHDKGHFQKINQEENKSENSSQTEHDVIWSEISNNTKRNIQDSKCLKYERINTSLVNHSSLNSSFYSGRISFGGASANSRFMRQVPYQINVRKHVKSLPTKDVVVPTLLSNTAQKVFDSLQNFTTPVSDAKKVPLYKKDFEQSGSYSKYLKSEGNRYHRDKSKRSSGPPLSLLSLNSFGHNAQGKIRNKFKDLHYSRKEQITQKMSLPDIPLPVSDLNDLKLKFEKSKPCFFFSSPIVHKPPQLSGCSESSKIFSFSSPIILPKSDCQETSTINEVKQISNDVSIKTFNSASTQSENNCSVCLLHTKDNCNYCNSQEKSEEIGNKLSNQTINQKPSENTDTCKILESEKEKDISGKTKYEEKDWECDVCWVRNPHSQRACLACETCRPGKPPEIGSYKFLEPVSTASFSVVNNSTMSSDTAHVSYGSVPVTEFSFGIPFKSQPAAFNNKTFFTSENQNIAAEFPITSSNFVTSVSSSRVPPFGKLDSVNYVASQKALDSIVVTTDIPPSCIISTFADNKTNKSFSNASEVQNSSYLSEICSSDENKSAFLYGDKSNESLSRKPVPDIVVSSVKHFDALTAVKSSELSMMKSSPPSTAFSFENSVANSVTTGSSKDETEVFKVPLETSIASSVPASVSAEISFGTSVTSSVIAPFSFGTSTTNSTLPSASTGFSFGFSAAKSTLPSSSTGFSFATSVASSESCPVSERFSFGTSVTNTLSPQSSGGFTFRVNPSPALEDKGFKNTQTFSSSDLNKSEILTGVKTNENTLGIFKNVDVLSSTISDASPDSTVKKLTQNDEKKKLQDDYSSKLFSFASKESSEIKNSNLFKENFTPSNTPLSNMLPNNKNASMFTFGESCSNLSGGKMFEFQPKQKSTVSLSGDTTTTFSIFGKNQASTSQFSPQPFNFTSQPTMSSFNKLPESVVSDSQPGGSKPLFAASTSIFPKISAPLPVSQSSQVFNNSLAPTSTSTFGSTAFPLFSASNVFSSNAQPSFNFGNLQSSGGFNFVQNKDNSAMFSFKGAQQQHKLKSDSQSRSNASNPFGGNEGRVYKKAVRRLKKHS